MLFLELIRLKEKKKKKIDKKKNRRIENRNVMEWKEMYIVFLRINQTD